jgi:membrane protein
LKDIEESDRVSLGGAEPKPTLIRRLTLLLDRSRALRGRLEAARSRSRALDVSFEVIERDSDIGGGILGGALAYRLFVFFLPLAFLLVAALGLLSRWFDVSPQEVGKGVGVVSLVTKEVAASSRSGAGWWVALVAAVALVYVTTVLHRAVAIVHALAWQRSASAAKTERSLGVFVLGVVAQLVLTAGSGPLRPPTGLVNIVVLVAYPLGIGAIWLGMSLRLPHGAAGWRDLLPGAALYGVGLLLIHIFNVYVLDRLHESRSSTYGALGAAAAILLGFYFIGRLIVGTAVLNATLYERRTGRRA